MGDSPPKKEFQGKQELLTWLYNFFSF